MSSNYHNKYWCRYVSYYRVCASPSMYARLASSVGQTLQNKIPSKYIALKNTEWHFFHTDYGCYCRNERRWYEYEYATLIPFQYYFQSTSPRGQQNNVLLLILCSTGSHLTAITSWSSAPTSTTLGIIHILWLRDVIVSNLWYLKVLNFWNASRILQIVKEKSINPTWHGAGLQEPCPLKTSLLGLPDWYEKEDTF